MQQTIHLHESKVLRMNGIAALISHSKNFSPLDRSTTHLNRAEVFPQKYIVGNITVLHVCKYDHGGNSDYDISLIEISSFIYDSYMNNIKYYTINLYLRLRRKA